MIKTILIPIDFSKCAKNALQYAVNLAEKMQVKELIIVNAYTIPLAYADFNLSYIPSSDESATLNFIEEEFDKVLKDIPLLKKLNYSFIKSRGYLNDVLIGQCLQQDIDLIVMGTKGASGIDEAILGTNTHRAIKEQMAPILAIPEGYTYKPIEQIALSSDYQHITTHLLWPVKHFSQQMDAEVQVIHVSDEAILPMEKSKQAKYLATHLKDTKHTYHFIRSSNLEQSINHFVQEQHIDLLVLFPRKHGVFNSLFNKSHSKPIVFHTKVPLLALSPNKRAK